MKIDFALAEINKRYKRLIRSSTGSVYAFGGSTINRKSVYTHRRVSHQLTHSSLPGKVSTKAITKAVINCFGLPTVSSDTAIEALQANVWSTLGSNVMLAMAETIQLIGLTGTVFAGGIPAWLVTGSINASVR